MPALIPTDCFARVVWLGVVENRDASLASQPRSRMPLSFAGYEHEAHAGLTRPSCSRVLQQYARNTEIKNTRQLSIMSREELAQIAQNMGLDNLDPHLLGASVVIEGIRDWTHVPPSSRLVATEASGPGLVIDMENRPCHLPAPYIDAAHPGLGKAFKVSAQGLRGTTAWVEREGTLEIDQILRLHIPDQRPWVGAHAEK